MGRRIVRIARAAPTVGAHQHWFTLYNTGLVTVTYAGVGGLVEREAAREFERQYRYHSFPQWTSDAPDDTVWRPWQT